LITGTVVDDIDVTVRTVCDLAVDVLYEPDMP